MYFFDVISCLYLWNVVQAALILLLISKCLLLVERDSLVQIFHAFVLCQYFDAHITDFNISFCVRNHAALIAENFRLVWVNPESHFLCCIFEFAHHIPQLFFGSCEQHHVIGKSQVREAVSVLVAQVNSHSFFSFAIVVFRPCMSTDVPC